jgi:hypothetical protein
LEIKVIIFLITILVAGALIYGLILAKGPKFYRNSGGSNTKYQAVRLSKGEVYTRWQVIMTTSEGGAAGLKSAVSEADKLVDNVLRSHGFHGETMGERLKSAKSRIDDYSVYDGLWRAHKLRNALAHEMSFDLVPSQAREALRDFERGLKALGAL